MKEPRFLNGSIGIRTLVTMAEPWLTMAVFQSTLQTKFSPPQHPGNYYGTPKPPAEPSPVQPDLVDQVLFDEEFDTEVQRKRTTSVSKMDRKDSAAPEEEEEEERPPLVNGLAGEILFFASALDFSILLDGFFSAFKVLRFSAFYLFLSNGSLFNSVNATTVYSSSTLLFATFEPF